MRYKSKKDENLFANFVNNMADGNVMLVYETGDKCGEPFTISPSTLNRWWEAVDSEETEDSVESFLESIDNELINTPYEPEVTPHVMEKPESVKEYENIKNRKKAKCDLPEFALIVERLNPVLEKVNENSKYVKFPDGSTLWRKAKWVNIYATEAVAEHVIACGIQSFENTGDLRQRPFGFKIENKEQLEAVMSALLENITVTNKEAK